MSSQGAFFKLSPIFILVLLLNAPPFSAQGQDTLGPEAGRKLAAELRSMRPEENSKWQGTLKIKRNHKTSTVPIFCQTSLGATDSSWTVMYLTSATDAIGAEKLTVGFSTNGPNQYSLAVAASPGGPLGEPMQLNGSAADVPLASSDFWLSDLGLEFYHWPQQERLAGDRFGGRPCYVLESTNPQPKAGGYSRVKTWIDQETGAPVEATAYGIDNKPMKIFELRHFRKVNGHWELKDMEMIDSRSGSQTHILFDLDSK